jgi:hypothetical protein
LKKLLFFAVIMVLIGMLANPVAAEPRKHVVVRGDTLWDLCEKYYGDPNLWPKLWEMNPFVTNPHLLKPGDIITLLEDVPAEAKPPVAAKPAAEEEVAPSGIDVSRLTNVESMGFLATQAVKPVGRVAAGRLERTALAEGDVIFVTVSRPCSPGDLFTVYRSSSAVKDSDTGFQVGYVVDFIAKIVVEENLSQGKWRGKILESYGTPVEVADVILPYEPISPCVQPLPATGDLGARIVGVKESQDLIGQYTVVYLDKGYHHGVRRGHVFEVIARRPLSGSAGGAAEVMLGHLLIVEARPDTATGVIMSTDKELFKNTMIRSVDWERAKQAFTRLPRCTLE